VIKVGNEHPWKLEYDGTEHIRRDNGDELLVVVFRDREGNHHTWAPRWSEVFRLSLKAGTCELSNRPRSEWLRKFAELGQALVRLCGESNE